MIQLAYDTDRTNDQWQILEPLIPKAKSGERPFCQCVFVEPDALTMQA
jgi:hypothetical protein